MKMGSKKFNTIEFENRRNELNSKIKLKLALLSILWGEVLLGFGIGVVFLLNYAFYDRYVQYEVLNGYLTMGYMAAVLVDHALQDIYLGKSTVFQYFGFPIALAIFNHGSGFIVGPVASMNLIYNLLCRRAILDSPES